LYYHSYFLLVPLEARGLGVVYFVWFCINYGDDNATVVITLTLFISRVLESLICTDLYTYAMFMHAIQLYCYNGY